MKALILIPTAAEAYSYWPIVGAIDLDNPGNILTFTRPIHDRTELDRLLNDTVDGNPPPCDHFFWGNQTIDGSRCKRWSVIEVRSQNDGDIEGDLDGRVKYQRDRLASGWHVSYVMHDASFNGLDNGLIFEAAS